MFVKTFMTQNPVFVAPTDNFPKAMDVIVNEESAIYQLWKKASW